MKRVVWGAIALWSVVASSTSGAQDCLEGLDVSARVDVLVLEHEPAVDIAGDGCVGVVVRPAREVPVRLRLVASSGETLHQAWAEPWAFVRGCGEGARWVVDGPFVTAAGPAAGLDMALAELTAVTAPDVGANVARALEHDWCADARRDPFASGTWQPRT